MKTSVKNWGNSLAIRLPKNIVEASNLRDGSSIKISLHQNNIILTPERDALNLNQMLSCITDDNIHNEHDWGESVGNEIW